MKDEDPNDESFHKALRIGYSGSTMIPNCYFITGEAFFCSWLRKVRHDYLARAIGLVVSLAFVPEASSQRVHLEYTALVQTVVGDLFGLGVGRLTEVTGCFGYDISATDASNAPDRGNYVEASGGYFLVWLDGHAVAGLNPFLQVENLNPDTFRFTGGDDILDRAGVMTLDGVPDPEIKLQIAITDGSGLAFGDDDLPALFPFRWTGPSAALPHTFSLSSGFSDRLLFQFTRIAQVFPPTLQIRRINLIADGRHVEIDWISEPGRTYTLQWSANGTSWSPVATNIASEGGCTRFIDPLSERMPGNLPSKLLYRVIRNP